jgi:nanoRNase/pAp phosphatase (c-di-AMP/oligoRNAs hydrolase)
MPKERLKRLFEAASRVRSILILPHNNPDPDAVASAFALRQLLTERLEVDIHIAYHGIIGRAENKALVRFLEYPLRRVTESDFHRSDALALVDAQPGAGNVTLPFGSSVAIVIDHHPEREATTTADFFDVRPNVGATSTILTEYLRAADIELSPTIATALFYGIKTDTMGLIRDTSSTDAAAFCYLQSRVDMEALSKIERAQVPVDYFQGFSAALQAARVYGRLLIAYFGPLDYPDLGAEIADVLLRLRDIRWVVCMGSYEQTLHMSVRTRNRGGAVKLVQEVIGDLGTAGGHGAVSGGQIPLDQEKPEQLAAQLSQRILKYLKISPETVGRPLIEAQTEDLQ